jgi:DUF438 domain-containing protein
MEELETLKAILDSMPFSVVFADKGHVIRYANREAGRNFGKWGNLTGQSIFACHNENSGKLIREIWAEFEKGAEERLITDNEKHRTYMRAVRNAEGVLVGYYERYEPPRGS